MRDAGVVAIEKIIKSLESIPIAEQRRILEFLTGRVNEVYYAALTKAIEERPKAIEEGGTPA